MRRSPPRVRSIADIGSLVRAVGFRDLNAPPLVQRRHRERSVGPARAVVASVATCTSFRDHRCRTRRRHPPHRRLDTGRPAVPHPERTQRPVLRARTTAAGCLGDSVTVVDEVSGFRYFDSRDLLGFVDGTENPTGDSMWDVVADRRRGSGIRRRQLRRRAEIPARPDRLGGALDGGAGAHHRAHEARQRRTRRRHREAARRTRRSRRSPMRTASSTTSCATTCRSAGRASGEFGTYFIGYSRDLWVIEQMLRRMFMGDPSDRTTASSTSRPQPRVRRSSFRPTSCWSPSAEYSHTMDQLRVMHQEAECAKGPISLRSAGSIRRSCSTRSGARPTG